MTKFGQSLEFSNGLFSNLNIETQREVAKQSPQTSSSSGAAQPNDANVVKPEVVVFTVKANFGTSKTAVTTGTCLRTRSR